MKENEILEQLWREAQSVEIPPELSPQQIQARLEKQKCSEKADSRECEKKTNATGKIRKWRFSHTAGSRVAAAAVVFVASLAAVGIADSSESFVPQSQRVELTTQAKAEVPKKQTGDTAGAAEENKQNESEKPQKTETNKAVSLGDYYPAESYADVSKMLKDVLASRDVSMKYGAFDATVSAAGDFSENQAIMKEESVEDSADTARVESVDFSTTNLQVAGVDESDIVKTDGTYIYIASDTYVQIVDASTKVPRQLGSITPEFSANLDRICEMYVADERLVLIIQTEDVSQESAEEELQKRAVVDVWMEPYERRDIQTQILTYDISAPAGAKLLGTYTQDGRYHSSRKIGDLLYLFTNYGYPEYRCMPYPVYDGIYQGEDVAVIEESVQRASAAEKRAADSMAETEASIDTDIEEQLPKIQGQTIPADCIYLPKTACTNGVLISSVNLKQPEKTLDQKLIFNGYATLYVSKNAILLYQADYSEAIGQECTRMTRFTISNGDILADCAEAVPGYVNDTFAIHETADGYTYVLTTVYTENGNRNQLFVLDEELKICGKIEHIADGETVYAARFVDDIGYFVTYRNTDPLFTVDFSDRTNPKLIGELEIPGFSDYLQFWDDTHLIGVGEERVGEDSEFVGVKVSLYDISNPRDVKESAKLVIKDAYYSPAQYEYKTLLADSKKNVIAFLTLDEDNGVSERIFSVQKDELKQMVRDVVRSGDDMYYDPSIYRNLYIGEHLYLVRAGEVIVYDMTDNFSKITACELR